MSDNSSSLDINNDISITEPPSCLEINPSDSNVQNDQVRKSSRLRKQSSYMQVYHCKLVISSSPLDCQSTYRILDYLLYVKLFSFRDDLTIVISSNMNSVIKLLKFPIGEMLCSFMLLKVINTWTVPNFPPRENVFDVNVFIRSIKKSIVL